MKTEIISNFNGAESTKYILEPSDFDYLNNEFKVYKDNLGINLVSIEDERLSIHIGKYEIKFDRDASGRRMSIATERVITRLLLLESVGEKPHEYKSFIPTTSNQLEKVIDEFKYKSMGEAKPYDLLIVLNQK